MLVVIKPAIVKMSLQCTKNVAARQTIDSFITNVALVTKVFSPHKQCLACMERFRNPLSHKYEGTNSYI